MPGRLTAAAAERNKAPIRAWVEGLANVRDPVDLDVRRSSWPIARADAVLCSNLIQLEEVVEMPANNLSVILRKQDK